MGFLVLFFKKELLFPFALMLAYACLALPMLARHHFDSSTFIVAGDRFVTAGRTPTPIIVLRHSDGYDGQFYYRFALAPLLYQPDAFGIRIDHPAKRQQRIMLPLLAHALAFGRASLVPAALLVVNLAGLFGIGWLAMRIARTENFPLVVPLAIVAWPGFLVALTHDTTEIVAAAFLLGGVAAWLARRWAAGALLLAAATLTRETTVLLAVGLVVAGLWFLARPRGERRDWAAPCWAAAALVPVLAWQHHVGTAWGEAPQAQGTAHDVGWPLLGMMQTALANLLGHAVGLARQPRNLTSRLTVLLGLAILLWFCARALPACVAALRARRAAGIAAGWLLTLALMSLLTANGPWIEPSAYYRALTESWVLGWILLGLTGRAPARPIWLALAAVPLLLRNWELCWIQVYG